AFSDTGTFSEVDEAVTISVQSGGGLVTQNNTNGTWSWSGTSANERSEDLRVIKATNADGSSSTTSFSVTSTDVAPSAATDAPTVSSPEFTAVSNTGTFSDVDDAVTISVQSGGGSVTQNNTNGTWGWSGTSANE